MSAITRVGTVIVPVSDQDRALGVLRGRARIREAPGRTLRAGPALDRGGAGRRRDHDRLVLAPEGGEAEIEVSLATEDADADHAVVQATGVEADAEVMRMGEGVPPMFTFRDPDGNRFRMVERD